MVSRSTALRNLTSSVKRSVLTSIEMHEPVLVNEVMELLAVKPGGTYIDGTVGSGGHMKAMLERSAPDGFVLGIDRDGEAIERARARLAGFDGRSFLVKGNFAEMAEIALQQGIKEVDGVLLDLGVSSDQLDAPERGFSFMGEGSLDMRMDGSAGQSAAELVQNFGEAELTDIFRKLGEERKAKRIARVIVEERDRQAIETTGQLARLVERAVGGRKGRLHPATRVFQALRIAVNDELGAIEEGLPAGLELVAEGGRVGVISFHSIEDRIVKHFFAAHVGRWESLQRGGSEWHGEEPKVKLMNKKPVTPSSEEVERNSRARSAKLRVAERI